MDAESESHGGGESSQGMDEHAQTFAQASGNMSTQAETNQVSLGEILPLEAQDQAESSTSTRPPRYMSPTVAREQFIRKHGAAVDYLWDNIIPLAIERDLLSPLTRILVNQIQLSMDLDISRGIYFFELGDGQLVLKNEWVQLFDAERNLLPLATEEVKQAYCVANKIDRTMLALAHDIQLQSTQQSLNPPAGTSAQVLQTVNSSGASGAGPSTAVQNPVDMAVNNAGVSPAVTYIYGNNVPESFQLSRGHPFFGAVTPTCVDAFAPDEMLTAEELLSYFPRHAMLCHWPIWRLWNNGWTATDIITFIMAVREIPKEYKDMPSIKRSTFQHQVHRARDHFQEKDLPLGLVYDYHLFEKDESRAKRSNMATWVDLPIIYLPHGLKVRPTGKGRGMFTVAIEFCELTKNDQVTLRTYNTFRRQNSDKLWPYVDNSLKDDLVSSANDPEGVRVNLDVEALKRHKKFMNKYADSIDQLAE